MLQHPASGPLDVIFLQTCFSQIHPPYRLPESSPYNPKLAILPGLPLCSDPLEILWFSSVTSYLSQPGPDTPASLTSPGLALPCSLHPLGSCPVLGLSRGVTMFGFRACFLQENYIPSVFASLGIAQHPVLLLFTLLLNKFCWTSQWMNTMYFFPRCSLTDNYGKTWHL